MVLAQYEEVGWSSDPIRIGPLDPENANGGLEFQQSPEGNSKYWVGTCENFLHGVRNMTCGVGIYEGLRDSVLGG